MVDSFNFYPHSCTIYRGYVPNPTTGIQTPVVVYSNKECCLDQSNTQLSGGRLLGGDIIHLSDSSLDIRPGDSIDVTLENGAHYEAIIKQVYPVEDSDFGGQDLQTYLRDVTN